MVNVQTIASGLGFTEGPVCLPDGRIAVVSMSRGAVVVLEHDGTVVNEYRTGGGPNGLAVDETGTLYVAQNGGLWAAAAKAEPGVQIVRDGAAEYLVTGMDAPNDLMFGPDGRLWVTDSRAEVDIAAPDDAPPGRVWAVDTVTAAAELLLEGPVFLNGIGFSTDAERLYVTATADAGVYAYDLATVDGRTIVGTQNLIHRVQEGLPDGLTVDGAGNLWVATTAGDRIDVLTGSGRIVATHALPPGSMPTNICAGPEPGQYIVTAGGSGSVLRLAAEGA